MSLRQSFYYTALAVGLLWCIALVDTVLPLDLRLYGIIPRQSESLYGILFAPLLHDSFKHLLSNTVPLLVLGTLLRYGYPRAWKTAFVLIYLGSGIAVWIFARGNIHIGASGLVFGMMFFIVTMGIVRWEPRSIALSCVVFFLYGGTVWGILPLDARVSFESHLFGALMGIFCAWYLKQRDPPPPRKRYDWEDEEEV